MADQKKALEILGQQPLVEVRNRAGHIWRFYMNGTIEGFENEDVVVVLNFASPLFHAFLGEMVNHGIADKLVNHIYGLHTAKRLVANDCTEMQRK